MSAALQKTSSALLALLLAFVTGWPGLSLATGRADSKPVCKCCDYDPANCATPVCCARPADNNRAPATPASSSPSFATERLAVAAVTFALRAHSQIKLHELPSAALAVHGGAVPIFQRD